MWLRQSLSRSPQRDVVARSPGADLRARATAARALGQMGLKIGPYLTLPTGDHDGRETVAQDVGGSPRHIHQRVYAKDDEYGLGRQTETADGTEQDHERRARDTRHTFARQHEREQEQELLPD